MTHSYSHSLSSFLLKSELGELATKFPPLQSQTSHLIHYSGGLLAKKTGDEY